MGFAADMITDDRHSARAAERTTIRMASGFRRRGEHRMQADILDLSTDGFRIETPVTLARGAFVWLALPGLEPKPAEVVWTDGTVAGCRFETPFHPSVVDRIVSQSARR